MHFRTALCALAVAMVSALPAQAIETYTLVIKDHHFTPETLDVPAGQAFSLLVKNEDAAVEEFESHDLKLEKIVPPHGQITLKVAPLEAGSYTFVGEFHEDDAKGTLVAK